MHIRFLVGSIGVESYNISFIRGVLQVIVHTQGTNKLEGRDTRRGTNKLDVPVVIVSTCNVAATTDMNSMITIVTRGW
jgi:hypothetical protein